MAKRYSQSTTASSGAFNDGLKEDLQGIYKKANQWSQARNAVNNTISGNVGEISNEMSNKLLLYAPYTIIGVVHLTAGQFAIFSSNDVNNEIGVFDDDKNNYTTIVNSTLLNFNRQNLIKGVGRVASDCGRMVYWDDGINPSRVMDLDNIPYIDSTLDIDALRLAPLCDSIVMSISKGEIAGELINGSYFVTGAYLIEGQRVTDYFTPSNIQPLFTHANMGSSIKVTIEQIDTDFEEFELILVQFANYNIVAKKVGIYSTNQKIISIDHIDQRWEDVDSSLLCINNSIADKSDAMFRTGKYLMRVGPTNKFDFNYQPLANNIVTYWNVVEYDKDYYRNGGSNVGYMRDEVYSFFIRWIWATGDKSRSYHIPGRIYSTSLDSGVSQDMLNPSETTRWKIDNTANILAEGTLRTLDDGGIVIAKGKMSYWESTELYSEDTTRWGTLAGLPIRHHKFPGNDIDGNDVTNHFKDDKIRLLGVEFLNIHPPRDNDGNLIPGIVGYEILRGSREGNKTILAKGIINNMRQYTVDDDTDNTYLYPNYPYNANQGYLTFNHTHQAGWDRFFSKTNTEQQKFKVSASRNSPNNYNAYLDYDSPLGVIGFSDAHVLGGTNIRSDFYTFHSPETNFRNPFLSAKEIKICGEVSGEMQGYFNVPKNHPRAKFINNKAFALSAIMGIGYATIATKGATVRTHESPSIDYGGTYTAVDGQTGMTGISAAAAVVQSSSVNISHASDIIVDNVSNSAISILTGLAGLNLNSIGQTIRTVSGMITGTIGGKGGKDTYSFTETAWGATPALLRVIEGIPTYLTFWAEGINKMLELIYSFTPYRDYALQQYSHGFYNSFLPAESGQKRRAIEKQSYLDPTFQNFDIDIKINNLFRSRTVALKLTDSLDLPNTLDQSQVLISDLYNSQDTNTNKVTYRLEHIIEKSFKRPIASHYVALKQQLESQYGQLEGITQVFIPGSFHEVSTTNTTTIFGGDTYIGRYTEKNTMFFFYDWLTNQPDGAFMNYKRQKYIPNPRFWMDTDPYDIGEFVNSIGNIFTNNNNIQDFDPFAIDSKYTTEQIYDSNTEGYIDNPNYVANPVCDCDTFTNCYALSYSNRSTLEELCQEKKLMESAQIYRDFLENLACYLNTLDNDGDDCPACNEDEEAFYVFFDADSATDPDYLELQETCISGPSSWSADNLSDFGSNVLNWKARHYKRWHCSGKGRIKRDLARADRSIRKHTKKYQKAYDKLYKAYLEQITGQDTRGIVNAFKRLDTPNDKYAFDRNNRSGIFRLGVKDAYMYLFNSGVRDFYVESEINLDFRDWGEEVYQRHYDAHTFTNLKDLFDIDIIKIGNYMKYDYSLSSNKLFSNFLSWGLLQDRYYNPDIAETCYLYRPKTVMYSLPENISIRRDGWRAFLPLNKKDFTSKVTSIKPLNKNGALMLFEDESPIFITGTETLELTSGNKIVIGDGNLFDRPLQNIVNSEYSNEYGSCQNRLAIANTPAGIFYMSQNQGKIFQVAGESGLKEISNQGMKWWFAKYLPYKLIKHDTAFLDDNGNIISFELLDNPVIGIGCQVIYDNLNQIVFFCKKDWVIRTDILDTVKYISGNRFLVNDVLEVELGDSAYFEPASWTVSWDPKTNNWISYHDWHPDLTIATKDTFMTTKNNGIWEHANNCNSYCNFYGIDYPFEVEFSLADDVMVDTLRNIAYMMEIYKYEDNCDDKFHVLDENFNEAIIYNTEQCSGLLRLNLKPKNNAPALNTFPRINTNYIDILYSKEEQIYKFNQFWDITANRGEFDTNIERPIFNTEANGYIKHLNPVNLNYQKSALERKKFRHYKHTVLLRKTVSGNRNFVLSLASQKKLNSFR